MSDNLFMNAFMRAFQNSQASRQETAPKKNRQSLPTLAPDSPLQAFLEVGSPDISSGSGGQERGVDPWANTLGQQHGGGSGNQSILRDMMMKNFMGGASAAGGGAAAGSAAGGGAAAEGGGGMFGSCCFIFICACDGTLPDVARKYRDLKMTDKNRRGYYRLSDRLVPLMKKYKLVKQLVRLVMVKPMLKYGKFYFNKKGTGWFFAPITHSWMFVFNCLGFGKYTRTNGEIV